MCVPVHVYSSLPLERFVQCGCAIELVLLVQVCVRLSLDYRCMLFSACVCVIEHVCIYMYIPVHVYRSLPLEHFVQVGV